MGGGDGYLNFFKSKKPNQIYDLIVNQKNISICVLSPRDYDVPKLRRNSYNRGMRLN